jgi:ADP-ribosylglycohydrolase
MNTTENKIKAVIFGHAVADALGVPVEAQSREELEANPVTDMRGFGSYPVPAGSWSDDTSMSLATLDSLADGVLDFDRIMMNFGKWYCGEEYTPTGVVFDIGGVCRRAIQNYFTDRKSARECGLSDEYSNGNGSLMRIHPFVLRIWSTRELHPHTNAIIDAASALTHAHERSKLGCKIYTQILLHLLASPSKGAIKLALSMAKCRYMGNPEFSHFARLFSGDFERLPCEEIKSSGYVVDTLEAALWCVLTTDSYRECVLKAVNLGRDTDTVAAIAGGLAGALYGYDAIPSEWLDTLKRRDYIEEMCERACAEWTT